MSSEQTSAIILSIKKLSLTENTKQENAKPYLPCISMNIVLNVVAQELLVTFSTIIDEVAVIPIVNEVFIVQVDGETIWDHKKEGHFLELKEL
ncbi:33035_t:CDS:2, partial [Gigaspora margarita]